MGVIGVQLLKRLVLARGPTAPRAGKDQENVEGLAACTRGLRAPTLQHSLASPRQEHLEAAGV
jgi:hypothetical protein